MYINILLHDNNNNSNNDTIKSTTVTKAKKREKKRAHTVKRRRKERARKRKIENAVAHSCLVDLKQQCIACSNRIGLLLLVVVAVVCVLVCSISRFITEQIEPSDSHFVPFLPSLLIDFRNDSTNMFCFRFSLRLSCFYFLTLCVCVFGFSALFCSL